MVKKARNKNNYDQGRRTRMKSKAVGIFALRAKLQLSWEQQDTSAEFLSLAPETERSHEENLKKQNISQRQFGHL